MTALPTDRRDAGFTIIEVLVALAVVSVSIIAIGALMASNVRGVRTIEQHVALMQATRTVMTTGVPPRSELRQSASSGQTDAYRWTVDITSLGGGWAPPSSSGFRNWCGSASNPRAVQYPTFVLFD